MVENEFKNDMIRDNVLKDEDIQIVTGLIKQSSRTLGLLKEFNENVRKSLRVVPIIDSLVSMEILRELRKIREVLENEPEPEKEIKKVGKKEKIE